MGCGAEGGGGIEEEGVGGEGEVDVPPGQGESVLAGGAGAPLEVECGGGEGQAGEDEGGGEEGEGIIIGLGSFLRVHVCGRGWVNVLRKHGAHAIAGTIAVGRGNSQLEGEAGLAEADLQPEVPMPSAGLQLLWRRGL